MIKTIIDFLFFRWEQTIEETGEETWFHLPYYGATESMKIRYLKYFVVYRFKHKFTKREYLKKVYLN